ncbi:MAG: methyltransferase domain-containing protein [Defluviicoccus sp.]|nr:methyltransferase domain-containing protein [Defluviicoccus sp.]MDE0385065.1 methyltransferase domain-containing protein [Defluviicoccus sp.]
MGASRASGRRKPRAVAHALLNAVLLGRMPLDRALADSSDFAALDERDRALVRHLTATVLRRLGQIDALLAAFMRRGLPRRAASAQNALRLGAADIAFLRTPAHAAVNEAVSLLAAPAARRYRGLANAVLRRLVRDGARLRASQDAARLNTPDWLWRSWVAAYGEAAARAIAEAHLAEPPLDITVSATAEDWARWLHAAVLPTGSLRRAPTPPESLPGFRSGGWWVQDAAAALPARILLAGLEGNVEDRRIADLCAAPGGKTAQLAAAGARVTALDISPRRLELVAANLDRLGFTAELVAADLRAWTPPAPFDAVLLDAPCTGTGTIRRRPDIARNKTPDDVARMADLQRALLDAAAKAVRPGGRLVYAVCSLQPEEGPEPVEAFLAACPAFRRLPIGADEVTGIGPFLAPDGDVRTLPSHLAGHGGIDGFHVCRLERRGGSVA